MNALKKKQLAKQAEIDKTNDDIAQEEALIEAVNAVSGQDDAEFAKNQVNFLYAKQASLKQRLDMLGKQDVVELFMQD